MSRARVIVGRTHDGYPVSRWQDTPADDARYGFMEPASQPTITTRKATPAELAAADAEPRGYLDAKPGRRQSTGPVGGWDGMATPQRLAQSRARGAARTHVVIGTRYGIRNKVPSVLSPRCGRPIRTGTCGRKLLHPGGCQKFVHYTPLERGARKR